MNAAPASPITYLGHVLSDDALRAWPFVDPQGRPTRAALCSEHWGPRVAFVHGVEQPPPHKCRSLDDLVDFFGYGYDVERNDCKIIGRAGRVIRRGPTVEVMKWLSARRRAELARMN